MVLSTLGSPSLVADHALSQDLSGGQVNLESEESFSQARRNEELVDKMRDKNNI